MQARMVITLASENPDDPSRAVGSKSRLADQDFPCPDVAVLLRGGEAIEPMKEMRFRIDAASPYSRSSPWRAGTIAEVVRSLARTIVDLQRAKSWEYLGHRRD